MPSAKKSSKPFRPDLLEVVREWPTQPGVYIMKDNSGRILYIGKAKSLRTRIKSYFQKPSGSKTKILVRKIHSLEFLLTETELEALLLECNLIKKHRPRYNVRLKDDKNYPYFVLDFTHPFPQFRITRKIKSDPAMKYYGPYSAGVRDISRFLLKTFQIRDCSDSKFKNRTRPCLNYEIGTCTAPCVENYVTQEEYARQVDEAVLFLTGKDKELKKRIEDQMQKASDLMEYEKARIYRDKLVALKKITAKQNAVLTEKQKDIDVLGVYREENDVQWVLMYIRAGLLTGRRGYRVRLGVESVEEATASFLTQAYARALVPDEIWCNTDFPDRGNLEKLLSKSSGKKVVIRVRRTEKAIRLLGMAQENAKLLLLDKRKRSEDKALRELQQIFSLPEVPVSIEGIDISNLQDKAPVGSLVHFEDGKPLKSRYRLYYPKTVDKQNDFAMIYEVVTRRFSDEDNPRPDLLLIDGGKGQLGAALKALQDLGIKQPLCSLAKQRTKSAFTIRDVEKSEERIFLPGQKNPIKLRSGNVALGILQQVRDEAHRFGVKGHRKRREKDANESPLTDIKGVGKKTKEKLIKHFETLEKLQNATVEEIVALGVPQKRAEKILEELDQTED